MKQALCIFRKDLDSLRIEVAVFALLAAVFAWIQLHIAGDEYSEGLLALAAAWLIARAVHADPIPGNHQFWVTRPYSRTSLIVAKLLFVAVCISLPISIAQLAVALRAGFTPGEAIPPLLFSQFLLFIFGELPVLALAALTSGLVPFILTALTLALVLMVGPFAASYWLPSFDSTPGAIRWFRSVLFALPTAAIVVIVLVRQYRSRATHSSRILAIAGVNLAGLLFLLVPASLALKVQSWLSKQPDLASGVTVTLRSIHKPASGLNWSRSPLVPGRDALSLPFELVADHLPPNAELRADELVLSAFFPDRPVTFALPPAIDKSSEESESATFSVHLIVDQHQFGSMLKQPLAIKGSVYMTLFGDEERKSISLGAMTATQNGLRCQAGRVAEHGRLVPSPPGSPQNWYPVNSIFCASLFQWPRELVYAYSSNSRNDFGNTRISYSPFPWSLSLTPIEVRWSEMVDVGEATILTRRPLAHFRRDFELAGVRFADFDFWQFLKAPPPPQ